MNNISFRVQLLLLLSLLLLSSADIIIRCFPLQRFLKVSLQMKLLIDINNTTTDNPSHLVKCKIIHFINLERAPSWGHGGIHNIQIRGHKGWPLLCSWRNWKIVYDANKDYLSTTVYCMYICKQTVVQTEITHVEVRNTQNNTSNNRKET